MSTVSTSTKQLLQAPGYYRGTLGAFEVVALSDGSVPRNMEQILSQPEIAAAEYDAVHETQPVSLSTNAYLIHTGRDLVLIDTGAGELFGKSCGHLVPNLRAAGYQPKEVKTILLTHVHADHSGGLTVEGVVQFSNATLYVDKRDLEYFVTREDSLDESDTLRRQIAQSRATVGPYLSAHKIVPIEPDTEILPGVTARSQTGHTPGHTAFLVQSENHRMLFWGDIIHAAEVQFEHPEITVSYDVDPARAARSRLEELEFAADNGLLVASDHISFPGIGHIRRAGSAYRWAPVPYNAAVSELDPK